MALKKCQKCKQEKSVANYIATNSKIHGGALPICRDCIAKMIAAAPDEKNWNIVDKICQWADIPFIPEEWQKIYDAHKDKAFGVYASIFRNKPYDTLDWEMYNDVYLQIQEENRVEDALPEIKEKKWKELRKKWGHNYDDEEIEYLENLHQGLLNSQNVVGALNEDQVLKLCKISLIIENKIRAGEDFDKDLRAYDNLTKTANLTSKTIKDGNEFNSTGEIFAYLEKLGWVNQYYDGTIRDEVDFSIKDIKMWTQYLYVNENGIADEIEQRIQNLKVSAELSGSQFDEKGFREYMKEQGQAPLEEEDFQIDI